MAAYPFGLALYFTEVPTPGVSGANGGKNKVSVLKLSTGAVTVIDEGDPDPVDVTVAPFGSTVYWTCRSAGVIVEAKPKNEVAVGRSTGRGSTTTRFGGRASRTSVPSPTCRGTGWRSTRRAAREGELNANALLKRLRVTEVSPLEEMAPEHLAFDLNPELDARSSPR